MPSTFKIVAQDGGVINHIKLATGEKDTDTSEVKTELRRAEAIEKKARWETNYFEGRTPEVRLSIVEERSYS